MKTILFSGRFDRYHIAHNITLARLAQRYDQVIVVVLDYKEAMFPIEERVETISNALLTTKGNFQIIVSPHHFGKITDEQLDEFPHFDVYGSGNKKVLEHITRLGKKTEFVPRYPKHAASDDVKYQKIKRIMDE